jgi:hypothetical protein
MLGERPVIVGFEPHPLQDEFRQCFGTAMTVIQGANEKGSLVYVCGVP